MKQSFPSLVFLLLITFTFLSCEKNNATFITGVVIDTVKNSKAVNQRVVLVSCYAGNFRPECGNLVTETRTNANGEFTLKFFAERNPFGYEVRASLDENYYYPISQSEKVSLDKENKFTLYARKISFLKLNVKVLNNPFKAMVIISGNTNYNMVGNSFDTTLIFKILPNAKTNIIFSVYDSTIGKLRGIIDTLQVDLRDTSFYTKQINDTRNLPIR